MGNFSAPLTVTKVGARTWKVAKPFKYFVTGQETPIEVPEGFLTDFASVPRPFWWLFPPDGKYSQASTLHDFTYHKHLFSRKRSDEIFLMAMKDLGVSWWRRHTIYTAVRLFGGIAFK